MKNEQRNLKDRIKKAMKTPVNTNENVNDQLNRLQNQYDKEHVDVNYDKNDKMKNSKEDFDEKVERKQAERPLKVFGVICIVVSIVALIFTGTSTPDTSQSAQNALKNKTSTAISAGTILLSSDENIGEKDYTITHKSGAKDTKVWVWDYAAEDGDYVQVLVDGAPTSDAFMIKHKPREITVPSVGKVQVKGIKDGGGGITYAIRYEINGTSYFNGAPEGEFNTYTLIKE
jgi:hypothetical protein